MLRLHESGCECDATTLPFLRTVNILYVFMASVDPTSTVVAYVNLLYTLYSTGGNVQYA